MRLRMISFMLVFLALPLSAQAQTGDWRAVRNLPLGARVSVKAQRSLRCIFEAATDEALVCERIPHGLVRIGPSEIRFDRHSIHEVRLEHSDTANALTGAAIGAGAGAALGASNNNGSLTRGGSAIFLGGIGGIVGGFVGKEFPVLPGKTFISARSCSRPWTCSAHFAHSSPYFAAKLF